MSGKFILLPPGCTHLHLPTIPIPPLLTLHRPEQALSVDLESLRYEFLLIFQGHSREKKSFLHCSSFILKKGLKRLLFPSQTSVKRIRAFCQPLVWDNGSVFTLAEIREFVSSHLI